MTDEIDKHAVWCSKYANFRWRNFIPFPVATRGKFIPTVAQEPDRLHELDVPSGWTYGFSSVWQRVLLFFGCGAFSAAVAQFCDNLSKTLQSVSRGEFHDVLEDGAMGILWSPLIWLGCILEGLSRSAISILILPVLGAALLFLLFGERYYWHGVFLILIAQPIQTLHALDPTKEFLSWSALGLYLIVVVGIYVRLLRNARRAM